MKRLLTLNFIAVFLLFVCAFFSINAQTNNLFKWKGGSFSGNGPTSWNVNANWEVWDSGSSSWIANASTDIPNSTTHTVVVDFLSAISKTLSVDVNVDVSQIDILNNTTQPCSIVIENGKSLSVYNTYSVSGTNVNLIKVGCPSAIGGPGFGSNLWGGGTIDFKPALNSTVSPIFSTCTYTNIAIKASGQGTVNFTENNLSFQSFLHELGSFNLNNLIINLKCAFMLDPVNLTVDVGNVNLLGSIINTQNVILSNTGIYNFVAQTTTINLNGSNTTSQICEFRLKGNNLSASTSSVGVINITGGKQVAFNSNYPSTCVKNVIISNLITTEDLIFDAASVPTEYHIKNWILAKPLNILTNNGSMLISFKDIETITTYPSSCSAAYAFSSFPDQVDLNTTLPVTANNMVFHNVKVGSGSITANNSVDAGYNTGILFNSPINTFGSTTLTWNGSSDTKWNNSLNWTPNCIPNILTNVVIPGGTPNSPEVINCSAFCYNFNTVGTPTVTLGTRSVLNVGGDFVRTAGASISPQPSVTHPIYDQMFINLLGVLPNTNYNVTSAGSNLLGCHLSIIANSNNTWYNLTDDFSVNYPSVNNFATLVLYSGGLLSNGHSLKTGSFQLQQSNVSATSTRSLNIANSIMRISDYNVGHSFYLHCPNTNIFNTNNSTIYFDKNLDAASDFNITIYGLPTNNHLATPSFSLNRVVFNNQPTLPSVIKFNNAQPNLTVQSGFKIKSLTAKGNLIVDTYNSLINFLNIDSLYVTSGYNLTGVANGSITINDYISSPSNCQSSPFFIKSSTPGTAASNQFYINTGPAITYTLNNWNIDAVRVNQTSGGTPAITIENSVLSGNTGVSPSNGWNNAAAAGKVFYWIGEGATTNWTDLDNWSYVIPTNGDDPTAGCLPSVIDDVLFTNLSFYGNTGSTVNTTSVVTVNQSVFFKDMRWLGPFNTSISGSTPLFPIITNTSSTTEINAYGSIRMHKTMKWDFGNTVSNLNNVNFFSTITDTIEIQNNSFNGDIYFLGTGRYVIHDSLVLCSVTGSSFNTNINKGTIYHYKGEVDALGNKVFACAYNSFNNLSEPRKLNIDNSKVTFIQIGVLGGGICFGNTIPNSYTLSAINSVINIKPFDDYCYTCNGAYNTVLNFITDPLSPEPRLSLNKINIISYSPSNTGYYVYNRGKGVDIDSLVFDVLNTHFLNTVTTETNNINYLKYKVSSTNELTSSATTYLKELDANGACSPLIIQSSIIGNYANLCPSTSTPLEANSASLKYINSACGAYVSPNYSMLKGTLASFIPTSLENTYGWDIDPTSISLGFKGQNTATVSCGGFPHIINTDGFNISVNTHTLIWNTPTGTYTGTPSNGIDLSTFTTNAVGVHTLTVYYTPNCYVTDTYSVSLKNGVTSVISTSNIVCNGTSTGAYSITATTGTLTNSTYSYIVTPNTYTTSYSNNLVAGVYSYTVADVINPNVCFTTNTFVITEPAIIISTINITSSVTCFGSSNGSVTSTASGGVGSYNYNWSNGINTYTTQNLHNISAGNYTLIVIDANTCTTSNTVEIAEPATLPVISDLVLTDSDCSGMNGSATYTVVGGTPSYTFVFANSTQSYTTAAFTTNSLSSGSNTLLVVDANACTTFTTFTINNNTVVPVSNFSISNACVNNTININNTSAVTSGSIVSYLWNFGSSASPVISSTLQTPTGVTYSVVGTQTISLNIVTDNGCTALVTQTVLIGGVETASLLVNPSCYGTAHQFSVITTPSNTGAITYTYNFGDGNNSTTPSYIYQNASTVTPTIYNASVSISNNGCIAYATNTVLVYPLPVAGFVSTSTCVNTPPHFFDASISSAGNGATITNYNWNFGDNTTQNTLSANVSHFYNASFVYSVTLNVTSSFGCMSSLTKTVEVYPQPNAHFDVISDLGNIIEPKFLFENKSTNYTNWIWNFGDGTSLDSTNNNTSHYYNSTTNNGYNTSLIVSNVYGCIDTMYRFVELSPEFVFYIPNAFSPNEDKINELFTGIGIGVAKYEMWIYDRWGEQIYYTDEIAKGWNGRKQGSTVDCKQDVYIWKVDLKDIFGKKHNYVGHVTLLR